MRTLEEVLADYAEEAKILERAGHQVQARQLERVLGDVKEALTEYLTWISEAEAVIRSPHQVPWFRQRFPDWQRQGLARWNPRRPRERQYRVIIVPRSADTDDLRADARRAAGA